MDQGTALLAGGSEDRDLDCFAQLADILEGAQLPGSCLLYTSDAADDSTEV